MKKAICICAILFGVISIAKSQDNDSVKEKLKQDRKSFKAAQKEAEKKAQDLKDQELFQASAKAIEDRKFVLETERVYFRNGIFRWVNQNLNFISVEGDRAVIQLALSKIYPGPNGLGGVTVDGNITGYKIDKDKKGNISVQMHVMGSALSATVFITLHEGSQQSHAMVSPDFNNNIIDFSGTIIPLEESSTFKGTTTY